MIHRFEAETHASKANTMAACMMAIIMNAQVHSEFGLYIFELCSRPPAVAVE